jgi:hypothetical protein
MVFAPLVRLYHLKKNFKLAGSLVFYSGSNESSIARQFKWLNNTFKDKILLSSYISEPF